MIRDDGRIFGECHTIKRLFQGATVDDESVDCGNDASNDQYSGRSGGSISIDRHVMTVST